MYEHSCKAAGANFCGFKATANSEKELRAALTAHAQSKHKLPVMTDTIFNYLRHVAAR